MSSLIINWRFGGWFFQVEPPRYWRYSRAFTLTRLPGRPAKGEPMVQFYQGRVYAAAAVLLLVVAVLWAAS